MFKQKFVLTIRDINYANHMDHLALLGYLHETRVRFLRSLGDFNELNIDGQGSGLVVAELNCLYKSECFHGDEIEVVQELELLSPTRLVMNYSVYRQDGAAVASAKIRVAILSASRKVIPIPAHIAKLAPKNIK
jgi:YbgC/YbaW family acyl-CoA thioester hydrolase